LNFIKRNLEVKYLEIHYETLELFTDELLLYVALWSRMLILDLHEVTDVKFEKSFGIGFIAGSTRRRGEFDPAKYKLMT
jgi:hypothetical protein